MSSAPKTHLPELPHMHKADQTPRRIGVEIEFAGLAPRDAAEVIKGLYGGTIKEENKYSYEINGSEFGDFKVEFDARFLTEKRFLKYKEKLPIDISAGQDKLLENAISTVLETVVPYEVTAPPLEITKLTELNALIAGLRARGAKGTTASWMYAFGLHLNVEPPVMEAGTLLNILRAFTLRESYIRETPGVNVTRRLAQFIKSYPAEYCRKILMPSYLPQLGAFIADYLAAVNSRDYALDMLPLFAFIDEAVVRKVVGEEHKVKKRPALHVRIYDSLVDKAGWGVEDAYLSWLEIERLAFAGDRLARESERYLVKSFSGGMHVI